MAALGARLFVIPENSASKKIIAYNFDTAEWEDIYTTNDGITGGTGVCWDGAYHLWWQHNGDYFKRLNLYDHTVSAFLSTQPVVNANHTYYCHNYNGIIYSFVDDAAGRFQKYDHGPGVWSILADPGDDGVGIVVPMTAANHPGSLFFARAGFDTFKEYDPAAGTWTIKTAAPGGFGYGKIAWANEYVYVNGASTQLYRYNVNANNWATMAPMPAVIVARGQQLTWDYNNAGYLYWLYGPNATIYRYDIVGDSWDGFATYGSPIESFASLVFVPRIRYLFLDSSGDIVGNPMNLGCEFKGNVGAGTLYYVKALEGIAAVTLSIEADTRTDADDLMDIALDVGGVPGAWGASILLGDFAANEAKPFWIRIDAALAATTQPRAGRLQLSTP